MANKTQSVLITGVSGNIGSRLLSQLGQYRVIGVDLRPPTGGEALRFVQADLGREDSCLDLMHLLKEHRPVAVVHLAFVSDPGKAGMASAEHMWQVNVAGTARVMEAITEANRDEAVIKKFVFLSSSMVYGPGPDEPVSEDQPLNGNGLPYAVQKIEAENVVKQRAPGLRGCCSYVFRLSYPAGAGVDSFLLSQFRGAGDAGGKRQPFLLPFGKRYLERRLQFVHVGDVARLIASVLEREPEDQRVTVLNVAGRGEPLTIARCLEMTGTPLRRVPGKAAMRLALNWRSKAFASSITKQAILYMTEECLLQTARLKELLGADYERIMKFRVQDAFADSFNPAASPAQHSVVGR